MARLTIACTVLALLTTTVGSGPVAARVSPATQPDGPIFTPEQLLRGVHLSPQQCATYARTVYVQIRGIGVCFRYYISHAGGEASEAVYFLQGDRWSYRLAYDPDRLQRLAVSMSRRYRRPAVYLARIGVDGSSGWHIGWRRTFFEVDATNRAIDAINARHGFRVIHLAGQSGGAHVIGGLLALRNDIDCAVPGAGLLAFFDRNSAVLLNRPPGRHHYDPATRVDQVVRRSHATRILVVTGAEDQIVPARSQTEFVDRVRQLGGRISQFFVRTLDERGHGVTQFTAEAMAGCLAAASDARIEATLQRLQSFVFARRDARQAGLPAPPNYREAVQPFAVPPARDARRPEPRNEPRNAEPPVAPGHEGPALPAQPAAVPPRMPHGPAAVIPDVNTPTAPSGAPQSEPTAPGAKAHL